MAVEAAAQITNQMVVAQQGEEEALLAALAAYLQQVTGI